MKTLTNNTTTNILSIDIDYAYSPTISVYDDYIEGVRISEEEQELILQEHNVPKPTCNPEKIKILESVIKNKINLNAPIILIENHDQILDFLPNNKQLAIYNFDHHHDVYYPGWHSLDTLDEGNWVYFLKDKNILEYIWIRNEDSENMDFDLPELDFSIEERYNIENMPMFDLVFFCISSRWTGSTGKQNIMRLIDLIS